MSDTITLTDKELRAIAGIKSKTGMTEREIIRTAVKNFAPGCKDTRKACASSSHGCKDTRVRRWMRQNEAIAYFKMGYKQFRRGVESGAIPYHDFGGGLLRFDPDEIAEKTLVAK